MSYCETKCSLPLWPCSMSAKPSWSRHIAIKVSVFPPKYQFRQSQLVICLQYNPTLPKHPFWFSCHFLFDWPKQRSWETFTWLRMPWPERVISASNVKWEVSWISCLLNYRTKRVKPERKGQLNWQLAKLDMLGKNENCRLWTLQ